MPTPDITFRLLDGTYAATHADELQALHTEVYATPPYGRTDDAALFADRFRVQRRQPSFARLARHMSMIDIRATRLADAKAAGELLAAGGMTDAVDALVALLAFPGDQILTSDSEDLRMLVAARRIPATVVPV